MITQKQLNEIREKLETAQNPLFFFDNDVDGLCSFIILRRALNRGKGIAIKSFPEINPNYTRKINELSPDSIIILDKPKAGKEFLNKIEKLNLPIIWIDHHEIKNPEDKEKLKKQISGKNISYYNSAPTCEPTTYIVQKIFNRQEDLWLATIGSISDIYLPEFVKKFSENFPEILPEKATKLTAFDILYSTELGKIIRMLNFGLMDRTTNVLRLIRLLTNSNSPQDLLEENYQTFQLHKRFNHLEKIREKYLQKAQSQINPLARIIFFKYSGEISMSSEISNSLYFKHKDKLIVVAYVNKMQAKINLSVRGKNAKKFTGQLTQKIQNSTGGGHETACGAMVPEDKLDELKTLIKNYKKQT